MANREVRKAHKSARREQRQQIKKEKRLSNVSSPVEIAYRTQAQQHAIDIIAKNDVSFLLGAAGSGKTFLAVAYAINQVLARNYEKIILTRPIVDAGEKLGYLPGTFGEKVNPYMQPLYDTIDLLVGRAGPQREIINKAISLAPLAYMRGRTFHNAICIFDEAQNATYMQLKLFLSRFGQNTKIIVTGDPLQSDLPIAPAPLTDVVKRLSNTSGIAMVNFANTDVVRHPLVSVILQKL
jgi:phosphate starvation-inducible PhoH-like protein